MNTNFLFSRIGLLAISVGLVICVLIISSLPSVRIDLTEDDLYSLSPGTKIIVSNLQSPLEIMFFYSESATEDNPQIRTYANRVQELLREIVIASNNRLSLNIIDPQPFSEEEDLATQFGIQAVPISQGAPGIYFGLVVAQPEDRENNPQGRAAETLPLIRPELEQFLEYEFMKLITKVNEPDLQVVGLLTELDIDGGFDPVAGQATQQWMIMDIIRQLYAVQRVDNAASEIDGEIDILMIVHPQGLSEQMLYAIDQFVMRGGKTMLFLDPNADSMVSRTQQGNLIPAGMSSELPGLLEAWGIEFPSSKVLTDNELALRVSMGQGQRPIAHLGMLGVQRNFLTQNDIVTSRLETINLSSPGVIRQAEGASTRFEPLMVSSSDSMLMDVGLFEDVTDPSILFDEFVSEGISHTIAARISGVIETAFPDGRPFDPVEVTDEEVDEAESEITDAVVVEEEPTYQHLSSSNSEVNILVFADTDMLGDRMWVQVGQFMGQRIPRPFSNNGDMVINALDNLSGGADLSSIRSRGTYSRPFTRVIQLQRQADDRLRVEEADLLDRLAEAEAALAELNQDENGELIGQITPEIQAEVDRFNEQMLETRRSLRDVQYQLTEDIQQLGSNLKLINTALIPVLLSLLALLLSYLRAQRRKSARA
ncbi:MAG: ABC transporter [SAR86 cluster bacterium]|uniref:ABC transporter n=1 Tax=SAR86 cluster bacterium TaxID=2030880 RepID=A0A2A4X0A3_9GAMM|nr:MAG: ABC transporter [SAR86 cluster bacterium]